MGVTEKPGMDFRGSYKERRETDSSASLCLGRGVKGVINAIANYCAEY